MSYGMSYDEYWHGSHELTEYYRKKFYIDIKNQNEMSWLQGLYIYNAIAVVLGSAFGNKKQGYMDKPIDILPPTEAELNRISQRQREHLVNELTAWAKSWDDAERNKNGTS